MRPALDHVCAIGPVMRNRQRVVPRARGVVLEPGIGTGLNLPLYDAGAVRHVIGIDPAAPFLDLARQRAEQARVSVELVQGSAEALPLQDNSVDTVLLTYTGCSIPDLDAALAEFRRVLKPDGQLLFCEHGRAAQPRVACFQDLVNPLWRPLAGGCNLNRDFPAHLNQAGFEVADMDTFYLLPRPKSVTWHFLGVARPR